MDDLISQQNRERLKMRLEDIQKYTPQLASAMKLAVAATANENLLAKEEAIKQRDLIVSKIVDALLDIIRTLQLINFNMDGWEPVDLNELRRLQEGLNEEKVKNKMKKRFSEKILIFCLFHVF